MKYTIELTEKQRKRFKHMNNALIKMGMGFDILSLLKPINVEDTNEYQIGYKVGFEDGKKQAIEEIPELANKENEMYNDGYDKGLEDGYKGYKHLEQWFAETCFFEDEDNLFPEYKRRQADTCCLEDIITDVGFSEVLKRVKAYEEKKKAEEEIKVGDEIKSVYDNKLIGIVTKVNCQSGKIRILFSDGSGGILEMNPKDYKRTGRNFSAEIEQLLDKLKGEE